MKKFLKQKNVMIFMCSIVLIVLILSILIIDRKSYNNGKNGNNNIEEIKKTILNIGSYKAEIDVTVNSNKNENNYKIYQEVKDGREFQKILEPENLDGMEIIYENGVLQIKNLKINATKIYQNYPYITDNTLFLTDFINLFKANEENKKSSSNDNIELINTGNDINTQILEKDGNTILKVISNNRYSKERILTINNDEFEKKLKNKNEDSDSNMLTMQIMDSNNNERIYIKYNNIEFNI